MREQSFQNPVIGAQSIGIELESIKYLEEVLNIG